MLLQAEHGGDEEAAQRQRQSARGRQARLRSSHGDALSALNALCAFEAAGRTQDFCRSAASAQLRLPISVWFAMQGLYAEAASLGHLLKAAQICSSAALLTVW